MIQRRRCFVCCKISEVLRPTWGQVRAGYFSCTVIDVVAPGICQLILESVRISACQLRLQAVIIRIPGRLIRGDGALETRILIERYGISAAGNLADRIGQRGQRTGRRRSEERGDVERRRQRRYTIQLNLLDQMNSLGADVANVER